MAARRPQTARRTRTVLTAGLLALVGTALACSRAPSPGEQEEVSTLEQDVPVEVRQAALALCERLGAQGTDWYWDREDSCWELTVTGLDRKAELDLRPDGSFDELELVYTLAEIDAALPEVGQTIRKKCRTDTGLVIELSLRREEYLDETPDLAAAWKLTGVVLEFQGPRGHDYELDARGMIVDHPGDDDHDLSEESR